MARTYTYTTDVEFGGDEPTACFEVTLSYSFDEGHPAWGGSRYEPPINPPDYGGVDDLQVTHIDGKPRPWGQFGFTDDEFEEAILSRLEGKIEDALFEHAAETLASDREDAADARYQAQREAWAR